MCGFGAFGGVGGGGSVMCSGFCGEEVKQILRRKDSTDHWRDSENPLVVGFIQNFSLPLKITFTDPLFLGEALVGSGSDIPTGGSSLPRSSSQPESKQKFMLILYHFVEIQRNRGHN